MEVEHGWSGEVAGGWRKAKVRCNENDLTALAKEFGFQIEPLTTLFRFALLDAEAAYLLLVHILTHYNSAFANNPEYQANYQKAVEERNLIITRTRQAQGLIE